MTSPENLALVGRLKDRNTEALGELYDRFGGPLYGLIARRVACRVVAEDLLQEVFLRIWNRISLYDESQGSLEVWMAAVARNFATDYLRRQKNAWLECNRIELDDAQSLRKIPSHGFETLTVHSRIAIAEALSTLSQPHRQVLELSYFEGFTQIEIALRMRKPLGTVKSLIRASLKVLRTLLISEPQGRADSSLENKMSR